MTRVRAAITHLSLSIAVFLATIAFMIWRWYPMPYFWIDGGWQFIRIAALVDIVLGPLLTLIVFRAGKPALKFDLASIAAIQIAALAWGCVIMYQQRPAFVVFTYDTFRTVTWPRIVLQKVAHQDLAQLAAQTPPLVFLQLPENKREILQMMESARQEKAPALQLLADRYRKIDEKSAAIMEAHALNLEKLLRERASDLEKLQAFSKKQQIQLDRILFLPMQARYSSAVIGLEKGTGRFLGYLDVIPPVPL